MSRAPAVPGGAAEKAPASSERGAASSNTPRTWSGLTRIRGLSPF